MRNLLTSAIALGILAAGAAGQTLTPPPLPAQLPELPKLPAGRHNEPLAPGELDLIGMPMTPPPVNAWPVGEPVTEFKRGTVYVFSMISGAETNPPPMGPVDHRFYLGGLQRRFGEAIVVTELTNSDGRQLTVTWQVVNSIAENPDVRTRVGRCDSRTFAQWCGQGIGFSGDCLTAIVGADGDLVFVVRNYHTLPWVLEQVIVGTFDASAFRRANEAADAILKREPEPRSPEDRLARYDGMVAVAPWLAQGLTSERARLLCKAGQSEVAVSLVRDAVASAPILDRWWLRGLLSLHSRPDVNTALMGPVMLDVAKTIAATSEMKNTLELGRVVDIARTMRDYDTAITYQTMIVSLANESLDRYIAMRTLRELEGEAESK